MAQSLSGAPVPGGALPLDEALVVYDPVIAGTARLSVLRLCFPGLRSGFRGYLCVLNSAQLTTLSGRDVEHPGGCKSGSQ